MVNNTTEEVKHLDVNALGGLLLTYSVVGLLGFIGVFLFNSKEFKAFRESIILFFSCQPDSLRGAQNIYNTLFALLLNDVLIVITNFMLAIEFFTSTCNPAFDCASVFNTFTVSSLDRCFGMVLHLLCTLVSILFLCHPQQAARLCWVVTVVPLLISVFVPVYIFISKTVTLGLGGIIFGLAVAIIAYDRVPAGSPSADLQKTVFVYAAMSTLLTFYVPIFVLQCLMISSDNYGEPANAYFKYYVIALVGANYQLFMDARLCSFMLSLTAEDDEEQQGWVNPAFENVIKT